MKRLLRNICIVFCVGLILIPLYLNSRTPDTNRLSDDESGTLTVTVADLGKADAILLQSGEHAMLIDAGYEKSSDDLLALLEKQGVSHLEALVLTHFDKDHVGGADHVLEELEVDRLLTPDYQEDSKQYEQFAEAAREALRLASYKLPVKCKIVKREDTESENGGEA